MMNERREFKRFNIEKETIVCEGKVVYCTKVKEGPACIFRIGMNFINVDSSKNQNLFNFIQHNIILRGKNQMNKNL